MVSSAVLFVTFLLCKSFLIFPSEAGNAASVSSGCSSYQLPIPPDVDPGELTSHARTIKRNLMTPLLAATPSVDTGTDSLGVGCSSDDATTVRAVCPGLDKKGRYRCIDAFMLCDGKQHCPGGEDENDLMCMFHKLTLHYVGTYGQTITKWILPLNV